MMTRTLVLLGLCLGSLGCGSTPAATPDAGNDAAAIPEDAGHDAFVRLDANTDSGADCSVTTLVITAPGFSYTVNGVEGTPPITLCRGVEYTFDLTGVTTNHPLRLVSGSTRVLDVPVGQTATYTVPANGPDPDHYECSVHLFGNDVVVAN